MLFICFVKMLSKINTHEVLLPTSDNKITTVFLSKYKSPT